MQYDAWFMHSSKALQSTSFGLTVDGRAVTHADYFREFTMRDRLALYTPGRIEGAGAMNLVMAHVTAFFDRCRATGEEDFFAYPEIYALFRKPAGAEDPKYHMFDIYPPHKVVQVGPAPLDVLRSVTDHGTDVLLVPDGEPKPNFSPQTDGYDKLAVHSARRSIQACYAYAMDGQVRDADIVLTCNVKAIIDWVKTLLDSVMDDEASAACGQAWIDQHEGADKLVQSYRRISVDEALGLL